MFIFLKVIKLKVLKQVASMKRRGIEGVAKSKIILKSVSRRVVSRHSLTPVSLKTIEQKSLTMEHPSEVVFQIPDGELLKGMLSNKQVASMKRRGIEGISCKF